MPYTGTKGYISHSYFKRPDIFCNMEDCLYSDYHISMSLDERLKGVDKCWKWIEENKFFDKI